MKYIKTMKMMSLPLTPDSNVPMKIVSHSTCCGWILCPSSLFLCGNKQAYIIICDSQKKSLKEGKLKKQKIGSILAFFYFSHLKPF